MRSTVIVALLVLAFASPATALARVSTDEATSVRHAISWQRGRTWHWQDVARVRRSPTIHGAGLVDHSIGYLRWIERRWNRRRLHAYRLAHRPRPRSLAAVGGIAHEPLWLCIHSGILNGRRVSTGEGSWQDGGYPYYGGLQMTSPWGRGAYRVERADLLSPAEQMWKAELGYRASGYSTAWLVGQWPNTAPPCLSLA